MNLCSLSLGHAISLFIIVISALFRDNLNESVKTLLAIKPQGLAGASGSKSCPPQLFLASKCLFYVIGEQSDKSSKSTSFPYNYSTFLLLTYLW